MCGRVMLKPPSPALEGGRVSGDPEEHPWAFQDPKKILEPSGSRLRFEDIGKSFLTVGMLVMLTGHEGLLEKVSGEPFSASLRRSGQPTACCRRR